MKKRITKRPRKRPVKQQQIIVLMDGAGNYYELPRATLERSRVKEHRKKEVAAALKDEPPVLQWIQRPTIPGSVVAPSFKGGRHLRYAGYYLSSSKGKR
jgi:hypothetical protein